MTDRAATVRPSNSRFGKTPMRPRRDDSRLTDAARDLAGHHYGLALALARPFQRRRPDLHDRFESDAGLALMRAAWGWESPRGVRFPAFAEPYIVGAMLEVRRRASRPRGWPKRDRDAPKVVSLPPDPETFGRPILLRPDSAPWHRHDEAEAFEARLTALPPVNASVCRAVYGLGMAHDEARAHLGMARTPFRRRHAKALAILARPRPAETA